MPTTTDGHPRTATSAPLAAPASSDPVPQLQHEARPTTSGPHALRYLRHPQALDLRGMPVICRACGARRDWLMLNQGRNTWVVCRCGNRWHEPEITRAAFQVLDRLPDTIAYSTIAGALAAMGFDGSFVGMYLE
ncbi:hypothetical protein [Streptomyces sp. NPDC021020]|uniref:hypothetical protein n=1 Tax=Streptomyces sp. NPDC021020 TaxID=3365109 RepID=UPI00379E443A